MSTGQDQQTGHLDKERERLVKEAEVIPGVAEALVVFRAASVRAPYVPPQPPKLQFSTGVNG